MRIYLPYPVRFAALSICGACLSALVGCESGRPDVAVDNADIVEKHPSDTEAERSIVRLSEQIDRRPRDASLYLERARVRQAKGADDDARRDYDEAIRLQPENAEAIEARGLLSDKLGRCDEALADFRRVAELGRPDALLKSAETLTERKQFDDALARLALLTEQHDAAFDAFYLRGICYEGLGDWRRSLENYDKAIELNPESAAALNNRALIRSSRGEDAAALDDLNRAIVADPAFVLAYLNRGDLHAVENRVGLAMSDYQEAAALDPDSAKPVVRMASLAAQNKKYELANNLFSKALRIGPFDASVLAKRGNCRASLGHFDYALEDCDQAVERAPEDPLCYFYRGEVYWRMNQYPEAYQDYSKAVKWDPRFVEAYVMRARCLLKTSLPVDALADCERAINHRPLYGRAFHVRGDALKALGKMTDAIASYSTALEQGGVTRSTVLRARSDAYRRAGNTEKAVEDERNAEKADRSPVRSGAEL